MAELRRQLRDALNALIAASEAAALIVWGLAVLIVVGLPEAWGWTFAAVVILGSIGRGCVLWWYRRGR